MAIIIKKDVLLAPYTTFRVGGPARFFTVVKNAEELTEAINFAKNEEIPWFLLGGGSNILVSDAGFDGLVIKNEILGLKYDDLDERVMVSAGSGEGWDALVSDTVSRGLWGLENLSGIPGSVGATPVQNIGAYGIEIKDVISKVEAFDTDTGKVKNFSSPECLFEYRNSLFKKENGKKFIITKVSFILSPNGVPNLSYKNIESQLSSNKEKLTPAIIRVATLKARQRKMPDWRKVGTVGSFFAHPIISLPEYERLKNDYPNMPFWPHKEGLAKIPAGWLIEFVVGNKGLRVKDVGVWHQHALILVNYGKASANEVDLFSKEIERKIFEKTRIKLEREVQMVG